MTFLVIDGKMHRLSISNGFLKNINVKGRQCWTRGIAFAVCPNFGKVEVQSTFVQRHNKSYKGQLLRQFFEELQEVIKEF